MENVTRSRKDVKENSWRDNSGKRTQEKTTTALRESETALTLGYVIMRWCMLLTWVFKCCCRNELWDGVISFPFIKDGPVYPMLKEIRKEALNWLFLKHLENLTCFYHGCHFYYTSRSFNRSQIQTISIDPRSSVDMVGMECVFRTCHCAKDWVSFGAPLTVMIIAQWWLYFLKTEHRSVSVSVGILVRQFPPLSLPGGSL